MDSEEYDMEGGKKIIKQNFWSGSYGCTVTWVSVKEKLINMLIK